MGGARGEQGGAARVALGFVVPVSPPPTLHPLPGSVPRALHILPQSFLAKVIRTWLSQKGKLRPSERTQLAKDYVIEP